MQGYNADPSTPGYSWPQRPRTKQTTWSRRSRAPMPRVTWRGTRTPLADHLSSGRGASNAVERPDDDILRRGTTAGPGLGPVAAVGGAVVLGQTRCVHGRSGRCGCCRTRRSPRRRAPSRPRGRGTVRRGGPHGVGARSVEWLPPRRRLSRRVDHSPRRTEPLSASDPAIPDGGWRVSRPSLSDAPNGSLGVGRARSREPAPSVPGSIGLAARAPRAELVAAPAADIACA